MTEITLFFVLGILGLFLGRIFRDAVRSLIGFMVGVSCLAVAASLIAGAVTIVLTLSTILILSVLAAFWRYLRYR